MFAIKEEDYLKFKELAKEAEKENSNDKKSN